jgi:hypothetical protein
MEPDDRRTLMLVSPTERALIKQFQDAVGEHARTRDFSFRTIDTQYGKVNISLSRGETVSPESETEMFREITLREILQDLEELKQKRAARIHLGQETDKLLADMIDEITPDDPQKTKLIKAQLQSILTP